MSTRSISSNMASSSSSPPSSPTRSRSRSSSTINRPMKYMTSVIPPSVVRNDVEGYTSLSHFNVLNPRSSFIDNIDDDDDDDNNNNPVHHHNRASVRLSISINDKNNKNVTKITNQQEQQQQQQRRHSSITIKTTNTNQQQHHQTHQHPSPPQQQQHRRHAKSWVEQANRLTATKKLLQSKNQFKASKRLDMMSRWDNDKNKNKNPQDCYYSSSEEEHKQLKDDFDYWDDYVDELSVYHEQRLAETSSLHSRRRRQQERIHKLVFVLLLSIGVGLAGGVYAVIFNRDEEQQQQQEMEMEDIILSSDSSLSSLNRNVFVPPVPSALSTLCSSSSRSSHYSSPSATLLSWDNIAHCEELCQKAPPCCTSPHSNCYESHKSICASYALYCQRRRQRRIVNDLSNKGEVKETLRKACRLVDAAPTDNGNSNSSSAAMMMTMRRDECFAACTPASCCFSKLFGLDEMSSLTTGGGYFDDDGSCLVEEMEWCGLYVRCGVLETMPTTTTLEEEEKDGDDNATMTTTATVTLPPSLPISVPAELTTTTTNNDNDSARSDNETTTTKLSTTTSSSSSLESSSNSLPPDDDNDVVVDRDETLLQEEDENEITTTNNDAVVVDNNDDDTKLEQKITTICAMSNILFSKEEYKACQDICSQRDEGCVDDDMRRQCQLYQSCHNLKDVIN